MGIQFRVGKERIRQEINSGVVNELMSCAALLEEKKKYKPLQDFIKMHL